MNARLSKGFAPAGVGALLGVAMLLIRTASRPFPLYAERNDDLRYGDGRLEYGSGTATTVRADGRPDLGYFT